MMAMGNRKPADTRKKFLADRLAFRVLGIVLLAFSAGGFAAAPAGDTRVVDAIERGDRDAVVQLLRARADANAVAADGMSALAWAAHKDDLELIRWIFRSAATCSRCREVKSLPWSE